MRVAFNIFHFFLLSDGQPAHHIFFMHLDFVLCDLASEKAVKMENSDSATCYLASEGISACRMIAIFLGSLGSVLSCGIHWSFVCFQNVYTSCHAYLRCDDY
jgi:hypothetical protein